MHMMHSNFQINEKILTQSKACATLEKRHIRSVKTKQTSTSQSILQASRSKSTYTSESLLLHHHSVDPRKLDLSSILPLFLLFPESDKKVLSTAPTKSPVALNEYAKLLSRELEFLTPPYLFPGSGRQ